MVRRDPNAWRYALDPRDPDYMEAPCNDDLEDADGYSESTDDYDDTDPRNAGPAHYIPMRNDV